MAKHKRIILVGKAASGKDYARKILTNNGLEYGVSYTTRDPRPGETDGIDYHFKTIEDFQYMDAHNEWYEFVNFNGWLYGTTKVQFYNECDLFIMTPDGLSHLSKEDRDKSLVIYFDIEENMRRNRLEVRDGYADDINRRIAADELQFKEFNNYDHSITNSAFSSSELMAIVDTVSTILHD
jgi:guanylate kinase